MSKWISSVVTKFFVDQDSLPPSDAKPADDVDIRHDGVGEEDDSSAFYSDEDEDTRSATPPPDQPLCARPPSNKEILAFLARLLPPGENLCLRLLELVDTELRNQPHDQNEFSLLWRDLLRDAPHRASATREEVWAARELILQSLLRRRHEENGSGVEDSPVYVSASGEVLPPLTPAEVPAPAPTAPPPASHQFQPSAATDPDVAAFFNPANHRRHAVRLPPDPTAPGFPRQPGVLDGLREPIQHTSMEFQHSPEWLEKYGGLLALQKEAAAAAAATAVVEEHKPLQWQYATSDPTPEPERAPFEFGAYPLGVLPPLPDANLESEAAEVEQARYDEDTFSLQMIVPAPPDNLENGARTDLRLPLAALFVPKHTKISCGIVETPAASELPATATTLDIDATAIPRADLSASLISLRDRFDAVADIRTVLSPQSYVPLDVVVRAEVDLLDTEDVDYNTDLHLLPDVDEKCFVSDAEIRLAVDAALDQVDSQSPLRPQQPFSLTAAFMPGVIARDAAVLFVPDDSNIPGRQTESGNNFAEPRSDWFTVRRANVSEFTRKVEGEWELLGRHKRKRVVHVAEEDDDEEEDGPRAPKMVCGLPGRDTIIRHLVLNTKEDDMWEGLYPQTGSIVARQLRPASDTLAARRATSRF